MKILMISSSYPRFEGDTVAPFIRYIAKNIASSGNTIDILLPYKPDMQLPEDEGINFYLYKYAPIKSWNVWGYASSLKADIRLKKRVYCLVPIVVISSFYHLLQLTGKNNYDILHAHWVVPNGPMASWAASLRKLPLVISLHGSDVFMAERNWLFSFLAARAFKKARWISACSDDLRLRSIKLGAPEDRIETVPYGVDLERFKQDPSARKYVADYLKIPATNKIIFTAGRLVHKKGFEILLKALPQVIDYDNNVRLIIAGEGDLRDELEQLSRSLKVDKNVILTGSLSHNIIPKFFSASDVIAVPSVRDEWGNVDGLPNVLMEALASGRPIVASRVAGIPQVIHHLENGLLVEEKNPQQLAEAIIEILKSEKLSRKLGQKAAETSQRSFSWEIIAKRFVQGYNEVLKNKITS
jgi:glycosyltransferase involved in cell wall biosynthesis